jgi:hypothetical protein
MNFNCLPSLAGLSSALGLSLLLPGCAASKDNVLATTATVVGVQIHQKDTDKTPEVKIGYARTEFAFVPTDKESASARRKRGAGTPQTGSAANSSEVLMEINAQGNIALGAAYQGGIYQRLAVGPTAVAQPGAAIMMAKDKNGNLDANAATAIKNASRTVDTISQSQPDLEAAKRKLADAYRGASDQDKKKFDQAAKDAGYSNFPDFISKTETSDEGLKKVRDFLSKQGINL